MSVDTPSDQSTNRRGCRKTDALSFEHSRNVWHMKEEHHTEEFVQDFLNQTESYMVHKYGLELHPATFDPGYWGERWEEVKDLPVGIHDAVPDLSATQSSTLTATRNNENEH